MRQQTATQHHSAPRAGHSIETVNDPKLQDISPQGLFYLASHLPLKKTCVPSTCSESVDADRYACDLKVGELDSTALGCPWTQAGRVITVLGPLFLASSIIKEFSIHDL